MRFFASLKMVPGSVFLVPGSILVLFIFHASIALADETIPLILNPETRHAESTRFELSPFFGEHFPDTFKISYITGIRSHFHVTPYFSIGADFGWSPLQLDRTSTYGATITNDNLYLIDGAFMFSNPAAYLKAKKVIECDFFATLGGGALSVSGNYRGAGIVGGGMKTYFKSVPWLAIRIDVRSYLYSLPKPGGTSFEHDFMLWAGPSFLIPPIIY